MGLEQTISAKKKNWKKFGLKALLGGIVLLTSPFLTFKIYEGKPWRAPFFEATKVTNPLVSGRYVMQKYATIWGAYGLKKYVHYRDCNDDGIVDQVTSSVYCPEWMFSLPLIGKALPKDSWGRNSSSIHIWEWAEAIEKLPFSMGRSNEPNVTYHEPDDPESQELRKSATRVFKRWYTTNDDPMPRLPSDKERWFLYRQDD